MQQLTASQTSPEIPINENFASLAYAAVYGPNQATTSGLTWGYYGGRWGGFAVADGTMTLIDNATNYIVVLLTSGVISVSSNVSSWNDSNDYSRVFKIATSSGAVTGMEDHRAGPFGVGGGGGAGVASAEVLSSTFLMATFRNSDMKLYLAASANGKGWQWLAEACYAPPADMLRDPTIFYQAGLWWVAYTNPPASNPYSGTVTSFGIASSPDLVTWMRVTNVSAAAISGVSYVWAPEWFVDTDGSVHIFFCATTSADHINGFICYEIHPTNVDMTNWSAPVAVTGAGFPSSMLDPFMVKIGTTYYLWYKNNTTERLAYATSSSIAAGYIVVQSGVSDWSGFGAQIEGAALSLLDNGIWRIYFDHYTDLGMSYAESADTFVTWTAPRLISAPADVSVLNHGTIVKITNARQQSAILAALLQRPPPVQIAQAPPPPTVIVSGSGPITADSRPATPDAADDEFEYGPSIDTAGVRFSGAAAWAWINQGTSTALVAGGQLVISTPANNIDNLRCLAQSLPPSTTAWKYRAKLTTIYSDTPTAGFFFAGLFVRNSGSGKIFSFHKLQTSNNPFGKVEGNRWTSVTSYSMTSIATTDIFTNPNRSFRGKFYMEFELSSGSIFVRFSDSGGNGTYITFGVEPLGTFLLSIDQIGIFAATNSGLPGFAAFDWFRRVA